jgi:hypothetical protein
MTANEFVARARVLQNANGLRLSVNPGLGESDLCDVESRLDVVLPAQVRYFYRACDGLDCADPALSVFRARDLRRDGSLIPMARFDGQAVVGFRADRLNEAGQWSIVAVDTGFVVTRTMASFWSNKVLAWLQCRTRIWTQSAAIPRRERSDT